MMTSKADSTSYDAIVIGAGHNGLVAAATLARNGQHVLVVEKSEAVGGMAANQAFAGGATGPRLAHLLYNFSPVVARELELEASGLRLQQQAIPTISLAPDGDHVLIRSGDVSYLSGRSHPDAVAWKQLHGRLVTYAGLLASLLTSEPPQPQADGWSREKVSEGAGLAMLGLKLRRLGKTEMREFLRIVLSNACDLILDEIEDGPLAGAIAADAVRGAYAGPRSPGTVLSLLYRYAHGGDCAFVPGGPGQVADALANAARAAGADIRTDTQARRIDIKADRVCGIILSDGAKVAAPVVLSSLAALPTVRLAGAEHFDAEVCRRVRNVRARGTAAKINLVLSEPANFEGVGKEFSGMTGRARLLVAPSVTYVERAFNPCKYGGFSDDLVLEAVCLPATDRSASGQHLISVIAQYVPHQPASGWSDTERERLRNAVVGLLARYAPGLERTVIASEVLTPHDIEQETGAPGGSWHHAELTIDQLLTLRPVNGMARYATGLPGLYLCGASAHPGGDVMGAAGRNAALRALRDANAARRA